MVQKTNADSYLKKPYNELLNEAQELVKQPKVPPQLQASIQGPRGNPCRHRENMQTTQTTHRKDPGRPAGNQTPALLAVR